VSTSSWEVPTIVAVLPSQGGTAAAASGPSVATDKDATTSSPAVQVGTLLRLPGIGSGGGTR
jgi:hypothetical protein